MYIVFEGAEACGKSTQVKLLSKQLSAQGIGVLSTREPGSTHDPICTKLRSLILEDSIVEEAAFFSFLADRSQHVRTVIGPALKDGTIVISDRSTLSTIVYHLAAQKSVDWDYILDLFPALDLAQHVAPDICFIASADYDWTVTQLKARSTLDRIELKGSDFHKKIHSYFDGIGNPSTVFGLDLLLKSSLKTYPRKIVRLPSASDFSIDEINKFVVSTIAKEIVNET